jgi:hypothetical protein
LKGSFILHFKKPSKLGLNNCLTKYFHYYKIIII